MKLLRDKQSNQLTKQDVIKYKESLFKIPTNKNKVKQYRNKSITELLNSDIPAEDLLSNTTIQNNFVKIGTFLDWIGQNEYCDLLLKTPLHRVIKKTTLDSDERNAFNDNDLKSLFNNEYYFNN